MEALTPVIISGIVTGCIYAMVGMGLVAIYKCTHILNFAQGELVLIGAYLCWTFIAYLGLPIWLGILLGVAISAGVGAIVQYIFARPLIGQPVFAAIVMTIGLSLLLRGAAYGAWGVDPLGDVPIFPEEKLGIAGASIAVDNFYTLGISLALAIGFLLFFRYSNVGVRMRATSEDSQAAQALNINVRTIFTLAWALGAILAAVGGLLLAVKSIFNIHLAPVGLKCLAVVFLGGLESFGGAFAAGLTIGISEAIAAYFLDPLVGGGTKEVFAFALIVFILLFKPYGFAGEKEIERV